MATAHDVTAYILAKRGRTPAIKLHKLLYYSQAWSLVWDDRPIFKDRIEAWANGPVVPSVYRTHSRSYFVTKCGKGDPGKLDKDAAETVDAVVEHYGRRSSAYLSDLTHQEDPWRKARRGLPPGWRSNAVITHASMAMYYGSLGS